MKLHAVTGIAAVSLAVLHPLLIYGSKAYTLGALRLSLWPEALGILALIILTVLLTTSLGRTFLDLRYQRWRGIHQLAFVVVIVVTVHAIARGSDLKSGWPLFFWVAVTAAYSTTFLWVKFIKPHKLRQQGFTVETVTRVSHNVCELKLKRKDGKCFDYFPGQFAFLKLYRKDASPEDHPFTISSSPGGAGSIGFTIKDSGDFTATIDQTEPGDSASIDGPYGRFSCLTAGTDNVIMIAGGVGITPMLSMLRSMVGSGYSGPVMLIWVNRTRQDIFCEDELGRMKNSLRSFDVHHVLTREPDWQGPRGHLNRKLLKTLLPPGPGNSDVWLCGHPE